MDISENNTKKSLISLTPLIDVVFILLIFFMLASSFTDWKFIELGIGEAESIPSDVSRQSLVTVDFNSIYTLNKKTMPLDSIVAAIKEQVRLKTDHPVLIHSVGELPLQELVVVLDAVGQVAGPNISLLKDKP